MSPRVSAAGQSEEEVKVETSRCKNIPICIEIKILLIKQEIAEGAKSLISELKGIFCDN